MAILDRVNWRQLDKVVAVQQRNRETHSPAVSLFRWWARRPHAVAGAILDAASQEFDAVSFLVSDPFSGGGTVAFEAVRRGLPVYAQDLYPWPSLGLATTLAVADEEQFARACTELLKRLSPYRNLYRRRVNGSTWELTHVIRVRVASCPHCSQEISLFREPFVSLASRRAHEQDAFYGCSACGSVTRRRRNIECFTCRTCGRKARAHSATADHSRLAIRCPHCRNKCELTDLLSTSPEWREVLVQEREITSARRKGLVLREVQDGDPVGDAEFANCERPLRVEIPPGMETGHLRWSGFRFWSDLYTHRQLQTLLAGLKEIERMQHPENIKDRLRLAVVGASEMAGYLCRWSRTHPKAFEAIANHRYARATVVAETNLLSLVGRGTLPRRLNAACKGLRWLKDRLPSHTIWCTSISPLRPHLGGALIVTGSSERQVLANGSAQLVLTDPPYHDDLQYGELSRLFHCWLTTAKKMPAVCEEADAVPNAVRGSDDEHFERVIARCLAESARTLSPTGRLVLTYHNNDLRAWTCLGNALIEASFVVVGLATVIAENSADHSKRGKRSFLCDLVLECLPRHVHKGSRPVSVRGTTDTTQRRNLLAIGFALTESIKKRTTRDLKQSYKSHLAGLGERDQLIV